jgi:hypothetical protein
VKKEKETSNIIINIKQRQLKESEAKKEKIQKITKGECWVIYRTLNSHRYNHQNHQNSLQEDNNLMCR